MERVAMAFVAVFVLILLSANKSLVEAFSVAPLHSSFHHTRISNGDRNRNSAIRIPTTIKSSHLFPKNHKTRNFGNMLRLDAAAAAAAADEVNSNDDEVSGSRAAKQQPIRNIVIAGGGIIGTSVAYYLVNDHFKQLGDAVDDSSSISVTLVDPTGKVGSCASGKAGGFLARDWRDGTPLQEMQRTGFDLHQEMADTFGGGRRSGSDGESENESEHKNKTENPTDYRRLTCAAVAVDETDDDDYDEEGPQKGQRVPNKPPSKKLIDLEWVDPEVVLWDEEELGTPGVVPMGDEDTIAQVHPRKLCETMWESIATSGSGSSNGIEVELVQGKIVRALTTDVDSDDRFVTGVELEDGRVLPSDVLVIACGPWTYEANQWFTTTENDEEEKILPEITAVKCHSILVPSSTGRPNTQAVFFDSNGVIGEDGDLEVYPRPDGDSYVNGFANEEGVCLERPGEEVIEEDKIELLREAMDFVENSSYNNSNNNNSDDSGTVNDEPFERPAPRDHTQQVCYWPETPSGLPIIGKIPEINGAYVGGEFIILFCFVLCLLCVTAGTETIN